MGKLLDYASYYFGVAWRLGTMTPPPDRIVALTTPPYLSLLARAVSKLRGADHAHWVMDLYPDVMVAHGMLAVGGWKHRLLAGLARWGFGGRRCAAVLTLGPDMAARCEGVIRTQSPESRVQTEVEIPKSKIINHQSSISPVSWVPLWGGEKEQELSVVGGPLSEKILPGPRVSSPAEPMEGERPARQEPLASSPDTSFTPHRPCESGDSRSGAVAQRTTPLLRTQRGWADDELIVMYSGNMGLGHRFGEVLEVALGKTSEGLKVKGPKSEDTCSGESVTVANSSLPPQDQKSKIHSHQSSIQPSPSPLSTLNPQLSSTRFVFYGGGKRRMEIEAFMAAHPGAPVELHDYAPAEELTAHLMSADVHLVSLEPAWSGTMVPSKLQGIFAVGRPVVFLGAAESSIGRWVDESGGGWVVAAGDVERLRSVLEEARDPEVRQIRGEAAAKFAKLHFDRNANVKRVVGIFVGDSRAG